MKKQIFFKGTVIVFGLFLALFSLNIQAKPKSKAKSTPVETSKKIQPENPKKIQEAIALGERAYIYGYPLVLMDVTKEVLTHVSKAGENGAPINQFMYKTRFPDADFAEVARPNADTLYLSAFLDLSKEPIILHVPNTKDRYYLMPLLDAWTNVFSSLGKRTTGTKPENFAIVGPQWQGELPSGLEEIKAPTNMVWIIGRIQTNGMEDYRQVNALQKKMKLIPLSTFGHPGQPPKNNKINTLINRQTSPTTQVEKMDVSTFFSRLAKLLKENPPPESEQAWVKKLAQIGVIPGKKFNLNQLPPEVAKGLEKAIPYALKKIKTTPNGGKITNGWIILISGMGHYGNDFLQRARVAYMGLGANLPQDAVYPTTKTDNEGRLLNGKNKYVLHFSEGQLPPVKGFWSLSIYDERQLFSANPINRYAIGDRDALQYNADGSLDIYIQHESPGPAKESNWLPAPRGKFDLTLRLYWPKTSVLSGRWAPPPVKKINQRRR